MRQTLGFSSYSLFLAEEERKSAILPLLTSLFPLELLLVPESRLAGSVFRLQTGGVGPGLVELAGLPTFH